jgi:hypothetical protein
MQQRAVLLRQGAANKTERLLFVVRPLRRAAAVSTLFGTADETRASSGEERNRGDAMSKY